jgi:dTDP-4-dehydrorhamnose 3,5-epimerase
MSFEFENLSIPGLVLIKPRVFGDARGFFAETYKREDFVSAGIDLDFVQDNESQSEANVVRGLHFQAPPFSQGKMVRVARGEVFDVAVDLRKGSPWYGKWASAVLSSTNHHSLFVPAGFAHGFAVTSPDGALVQYKMSDVYSAGNSSGIIWDDPDIGVPWPIDQPDVSDADGALQSFREFESPFVFDEATQ